MTPNNRSILKNISLNLCRSLSSQISAFNTLLREQNPQSELSITASINPQKQYMRFTVKDFPAEPPQLRLSNELHRVLCKYWPCSCGKSHDKMLGGCQDIRLGLQSDWTNSAWASGEFDILLQHEKTPLCCNVTIQSRKCVSVSQYCELHSFSFIR